MPLLTLTTDLGTKDHYLASLKAAIYNQDKDLNVIDITHDIRKFNILEGALILKNCFKNFPLNTIHLIGIDDELNYFVKVNTSNKEYVTQISKQQ